MQIGKQMSGSYIHLYGYYDPLISQSMALQIDRSIDRTIVWSNDTIAVLVEEPHNPVFEQMCVVESCAHTVWHTFWLRVAKRRWWGSGQLYIVTCETMPVLWHYPLRQHRLWLSSNMWVCLLNKSMCTFSASPFKYINLEWISLACQIEYTCAPRRTE